MPSRIFDKQIIEDFVDIGCILIETLFGLLGSAVGAEAAEQRPGLLRQPVGEGDFVPGDGPDDERRHVNHKVEAEVERDVPQLAADVVVAVGLLPLFGGGRGGGGRGRRCRRRLLEGGVLVVGDGVRFHLDALLDRLHLAVVVEARLINRRRPARHFIYRRVVTKIIQN